MNFFLGKIAFTLLLSFTFTFIIEPSSANQPTRLSTYSISHGNSQIISDLNRRKIFLLHGSSSLSQSQSSLSLQGRNFVMFDHMQGLRGGSGSSSLPRKKKKSKKNTKASSSTSTDQKKQSKSTSKSISEQGTKQMSDAIKENDSAKLLGKAIRDRKDILQKDPILPPPMDVNDIDASLLSLGLSLGTSDPRSSFSATRNTGNEPGQHDTYDCNIMDGGGVEAARTSILANYFLQSHGGAYAFQCTVSALSVIMGMMTLLLPTLPFLSPNKNVSIENLQIVFLRRSLLFALLKHASGLLAAAFLSARRIPEIGLYKTRKLVEELATDPVAQYLFYCALLLVWIPSNILSTKTSGTATGKTSSSELPIPWFLASKIQRPTLFIFLGPILLREIIHSAWVVYDVCVILGSSTKLSPLLKICKSSLDAFMSILLTPKVWRKADSRRKQQLLAKLVSRASLLLELCTGTIILVDTLRSLFLYSVSPADSRQKLLDLMKKGLCVRLYINYMLIRKKKIISLVGTIRGGASYVPDRLIDFLLEPKKAMGISESKNVGADKLKTDDKGSLREGKWINYVGDAFGFN